VVNVPAAIKDHFRNAFLQGTLCYNPPDLFGRFRISRGRQLGTQLRLNRGGGHESMSDAVIDDLGVNVVQTPVHIEARALRRSNNALPQATMPFFPGFTPTEFGHL
jgi:hypothetical protein